MIVMKFGGTSVGGVEPIRNLVRLVRAERDRQPLVVVSAMSGVTDLLLTIAEQTGASRRAAVDHGLRQFAERHRAAAEGAIDEPVIRSDVVQSLAGLTAELAAECRRGLGTMLTARQRDRIAACGERASSLIVAGALASRGLPARALDARGVIVTDDRFGAARPQPAPTHARAEAILRPLLAAGLIPVVTGYIGASRRGETTTLGRGGSDYSASILGQALDAAEIWIWTDVAGVLSADPRLIAEARPLPRLSYREAAELARGGAKVLHPETMRPAEQAGIPLRIKSSFAPEEPGTLIEAGPGDYGRPRAIAGLDGVSLLTVDGGPASDRLDQTLGQHDGCLLLDRLDPLTGRQRVVARAGAVESLIADLARLAQPGQVERLDGLALLTLAGREIGSDRALAERIGTLLDAAGIAAVAVERPGAIDAQTLLVSSAALSPAMRLLHRALLAGEEQVVEPVLATPVPGRPGWTLGLV